MPCLPRCCPGSFPGVYLLAIGRASPWCIALSLPSCRQFAHEEQSRCGGAGLLLAVRAFPSALASSRGCVESLGMVAVPALC